MSKIGAVMSEATRICGSKEPRNLPIVLIKMQEELGEVASAGLNPAKSDETDSQEAADLLVVTYDYMYTCERQMRENNGLSTDKKSIEDAVAFKIKRSLRKWAGGRLNGDPYLEENELVVKHQVQPTDQTCTMTCIAMVLGIPATQAVEEFHYDYINSIQKPSAYFKLKNIAFKTVTESRGLEYDNVYIATVPSLNTVAGTHSIVIDATDNFTVYDPNMGREGKKFYWYPELDGCPPEGSDPTLAVRLNSYRVDYKFNPVEILIWREQNGANS